MTLAGSFIYITLRFSFRLLKYKSQTSYQSAMTAASVCNAFKASIKRAFCATVPTVIRKYSLIRGLSK